MRRGVFILLVFLMGYVSAGAVGLSPASKYLFFEPNKEINFSFSVFGDGNETIEVSLGGDLAKYAELSESIFNGSGNFYVRLLLPEKLEKPGINYLYVSASEKREASKSSGSFIGSRAITRAVIKVFSPYPGKYVEGTFKVDDINEGENTRVHFDIRNLGTENLYIQPIVEIYPESRSKVLLRREFNKTFVKSKETLKVNETLETKHFSSGDYATSGIVEYGGEILVLNGTFRVGKKAVKIEDYDYGFYTGKINRFNVVVKSLWNSPMKNVFYRISIIKDNIVVASFYSPSVSLKPWEKKILTGYFDATNFSAGRYIADIIIRFDGSTERKTVAVYLANPPKKKNYYLEIFIGLVIAIFLCIITIIYLVWRMNHGRKR
ncbi:hypothetical protein D6829_01680 [Candidatus Pacearchaeota archaeon]|nr:MAG: hypothetical protein D6829_01680 [Candidatus Pacearchaeota archaeon]